MQADDSIETASESAKPLRNIRILELGGYIAAPYASSILCALGADVVKVERPVTGDDFRRQQNDRSPYFIQYSAGKRSLAVDIKQPEGVALVKELIPRFDVLVENLRVGKLESMGLGAADCMALNPKLIYTSVTGFGSGGPLAQRAAYDTIGQAVGGLYSLLSDASTKQLGGTPLADLITGVSTATGILAALVGRGVSGTGQRVETSVMEAVSLLTIDALSQYFEDGGKDPSRQSRHPQAQNFCLPTADGEYLAIHLSSSAKFWLAFLSAIDRRDLAEDPRFVTYNDRVQHYFELVELVEGVFARHSQEHWEQRLIENDVPFGPVHTISSYLADPQSEWLGVVEPERDGVSLVRPPWRFEGQRPSRGGKAPRVGRHTREIAAEVYDEAQIDALIEAGVIWVDPELEPAQASGVASS